MAHILNINLSELQILEDGEPSDFIVALMEKLEFLKTDTNFGDKRIIELHFENDIEPEDDESEEDGEDGA